MRAIFVHLQDLISHLAVVGMALAIVGFLMALAPRERPDEAIVSVCDAEHGPTCSLCQASYRFPRPRARPAGLGVAGEPRYESGSIRLVQGPWPEPPRPGGAGRSHLRCHR